MTQESIVDQPMKSAPSLPFEVIAVPQYNTQLVNSTNHNFTDPINIKIRIRNKEEKGDKYGIVSPPKLFASNGKKARLVSSDQTIMSFDLFVDPDTSKKFQKKSHKNFFHFLKPGRCLRIKNENDDKSSYVPSAINDVAIPKSTCSIVETNIISEKNVLKKNFPPITSTERNEKQLKAFMGICKPGGCLDPPFNEDKYTYEPALLSSTSLKYKNNDKESLSPKTTSLYTDSEIKIETKEKSENIEKSLLEENKAPDAHSLITYPTSSSSNDFRMHKESHDIKFKSRLSSEDKARISVNEFSEIFFMPPKKEKPKKVEKNLTEKDCTIKDADFDNERSSYYLLRQEQLKSSAVILDSKSSVDNNIDESKLIIENIQENVKSFESIQNIKESKTNLLTINADANTVVNTSYPDHLNISKITEFPLENKVSNDQNDVFYNNTTSTEFQEKDANEQDNFADKHKETIKNKFEETIDTVDIKSSLNNITIQKTNSITTASPGDTQTKELLDSYSKSAETVEEHKEIADIVKLREPSFNRKEFQNTDLYNNTNYIADSEIVSNDQHNSINGSQGSYKEELEQNVDISQINAINSKEMENIELNNSVNYPPVESKESEESFKNKLDDITNATEISAAFLNSKDDNLHTIKTINNDVVKAKESQYSQKNKDTSVVSVVGVSIDVPSASEVNKNFITSEDGDEDTLETNNNTDNTLIPMGEKILSRTLSDREEKFEIDQNLNNTFSDDSQSVYSDKNASISTNEKDNLMDTSKQEKNNNFSDDSESVYSSDKKARIRTNEKDNLMDTLKQEKDYVKEQVDKNIIDSHLKSNHATPDSRIESVSLSTELLRQTSKVNLIRKKTSLTLIQDEQGEILLRSTQADRKDSVVEKLKQLYSSESVINSFKSNRNIYNAINKNVDGSYKSENSIIHKNVGPLEDQSLNINVKSWSKILNVNDYINSRHQPNSNVANSDFENYTKTNLEDLQNNNLKLNQADVEKQEEAQTNNKDEPCHEDFSKTTYSSIAIDFGFQYSVDNDKLIIQTVDTSPPLNKGVGDKTTFIKSMIRTNGDEIRIPIELDIDLALVIKKAKGEVTTSPMGHKYEQKIFEKTSEKGVEKEDLLPETLHSLYNTLVPLNIIIQNLKEEADMLTRQQTYIKETLKIMENKPIRFIHTNAHCGCRKK